MIRAELYKYFSLSIRSVFWVLNAIGLVLLLMYSFVLIGMHQAGLMQVNALDYLTASLNIYITTLLPFLFCLFAAYTITAEFQWRTLMLPFFEGASRGAILRSKVALCAIAILVFIAIYLAAAGVIAGGLFSFEDVLLESRSVSPAEVILRTVGAALWVGLFLFPFGLLAMLLAIQLRNLLIGGFGSGLAFFVSMFTQNSPYSPVSPIIQVAQKLLQSADLSTAYFTALLLRAVAVEALMILGLLALLWQAFKRNDLILD